MKIRTAWIAALLLTSSGVALAQQPQPEPSLGQKADRVFDRMEDGIQGIWNRARGRDAAPQVPRNAQEDPTRRMGAGNVAPPADPGMDSLRRQRMDDAYRNWQLREERLRRNR